MLPCPSLFITNLPVPFQKQTSIFINLSGLTIIAKNNNRQTYIDVNDNNKEVKGIPFRNCFVYPQIKTHTFETKQQKKTFIYK